MTAIHRMSLFPLVLALALALVAQRLAPVAPPALAAANDIQRTYDFPSAGCLGRILNVVNVATHPNLGTVWPNALVPRGTVIQLVGTAEQQNWGGGVGCSNVITTLSFGWSATYQANDGDQPMDATGSLIGGTTLTPTLNANNAGMYVVTLQTTNPNITARISIQVSETGNRWINIGPDRTVLANFGGGAGRIDALAFDPNQPGTLYAGTAQGGVWKSTNSGSNWAPKTDNKGLPSLGVSTLAVGPDGSVYVGTGDPIPTPYQGLNAARPGKGVYKSSDGGTTWNPSGTGGPGCAIPFGGYPPYTNTHRILVDPGNAARVFAATDVGLFRSDNGGDCWTSIQGTISGLVVDDLAFEPGNTSHLYALARQSGMYDSYDPGSAAPNWTNRKSPPCGTNVVRGALAVTPAAAATVYVDFACYYSAINDSQTPYWRINIFRSNDRGGSWTALPPTPDAAQNWHNFAIAVDPFTPNTVFHAGIPLWRYRFVTPGGYYWANYSGPRSGTSNAAGSDLHGDVQALVFDPNDATKLYLAEDGGIRRFDFTPSAVVSPTNWTSLNANLVTVQFNRIGLNPNWPGDLGGGTQDNDSQRRYGSGRTWAQIARSDGDGTWVSYDAGFNYLAPGYTAPFLSTIYFQGGGIIRYDPTLTAVDDDGQLDGYKWIGNAMSFYSDPFRPGVMLATSPTPTVGFAGGQLFYASGVNMNSLANWTCIDPTPSPSANDLVSAVGFARVFPASGSAQYYVGTNLGQIYLVTVPAAPTSYRGCDAGTAATASLIYAAAPLTAIYHLAEAPQQPCLLYVMLAGASDPASRVLRIEGTVSSGGCGGWTVQTIGQGLPSDFFKDAAVYIHTYPIAADPSIANRVYVGSDQGLFVGEYNGSGWTWARSLDVPDTTVTDIRAHVNAAGTFGTIYAATFGRGVYERVIVSAGTSNLVHAAQVVSDTITRCQVRDMAGPDSRWQIADIEVDYSYSGDHGDGAHIRPTATVGGLVSPYFIRETQPVYSGTHSANLQLIYGASNAPPGLSSDGLQIEMYDNGGSFLTANCYAARTWRRDDARVLEVHAEQPDASDQESGGTIEAVVPITVTLSHGSAEVHHTPFTVILTAGLSITLSAPGLRTMGEQLLAFHRWSLSTHAQSFDSPAMTFGLYEDTSAFGGYVALDQKEFLPVISR